MPIKLLDRLLFAQGGACFFCSARLPREEATVEHLEARANGGSNADRNCVACCREINTLLGSLSLKEKLRIVLNQKGKFVCPNRTASAVAATPATIAKSSSLTPAAKPAQAAAVVRSEPTHSPAYCTLVLKDLKKRGECKPKRVESLKNTIRSIVKAAKGSLTEPQLDALLKHLQTSGKIQINGAEVSYSL